jgi:hypothetical protein
MHTIESLEHRLLIEVNRQRAKEGKAPLSELEGKLEDVVPGLILLLFLGVFIALYHYAPLLFGFIAKIDHAQKPGRDQLSRDRPRRNWQHLGHERDVAVHRHPP